MLVLLAAAIGYLLGSIPFAFLLVRWRARVDIRTSGSGNVGTLNSYEVTGSKIVGGGVLMLDLLKGVAAVVVGGLIAPETEFEARAVAGVAAVAGHNFPLWLGFKGGRGLATAAGAFLVVQWLMVLAWVIGWGVGFLWLRRVNPANALASVLTMLALLVVPTDVLLGLLPNGATVSVFRLFGVATLLLILIKHVEPVKEFVEERRKNVRSGQ